MDRIDKVKLWIPLVFRVILVGAGIFAVYKQDWINLAFIVITLFLTFLPSLFEKRFRIDYPSEFEILILIFIIFSMYLGEVHKFYYVFWWWDLMLHALSGIIIGIIGFSLVYILNEQRKIKLDLSPMFVAIFSFSFAIAIGVVWEIFEFSMDSLFGFNMQKSGLVDTMWDLIVDMFGALIVSALGYLYLKGRFDFFKSFEKWFIKHNPRLFKK
ncbi:MAG: hypothetical protein ABII01_06620 [Candidatus Woesearchaeota archaeon]